MAKTEEQVYKNENMKKRKYETQREAQLITAVVSWIPALKTADKASEASKHQWEDPSDRPALQTQIWTVPESDTLV